ncbi:T9SS type A sorting domain-containing protein [Aquimarina agarilytica]|uniref:T9SS type A sorting domain-containing protein n=1 Tax=Aquimarina agarilytica TaxID=1087449 RepID=UPI0002895EEE|nr:T9SS type A sorting domain-containing protein [Aquimarina agarilytica]
MKINFFWSILLCLHFSFSSNAQIQDGIIDDPGDIAFVGYFFNGASGNNEGFSFLFLDDCPIGTKIRFDDEEWTGSSFDSANREGQVLWENNTGLVIESGTVITIINPSNNTGFPISASLGIATEDNAGFVLTPDDQIYAYIGTRDNPEVFLSFIGEDESLSVADATLSGTGLKKGETAFVVNNGGFYSGLTNCEGTIDSCSLMINDINNWTLGDFSFPMGIPNSFGNVNIIATLGIQDHVIDIVELSVYPNPTSGKLSINSTQEIIQTELLSMEGVVQLTTSGEKELDISLLSQGTYILRVITNGMIHIEQIIKN